MVPGVVELRRRREGRLEEAQARAAQPRLGREADALDGGAGGREVVGHGDDEARVVREAEDGLDLALAEARPARERRGAVVAQRAGEDLGGGRGAAVEPELDARRRRGGGEGAARGRRRLRGEGLAAVRAAAAAGPLDDSHDGRAVVEEERGGGHGLLEGAAAVAPEVDDEAHRAARGEVAQDLGEPVGRPRVELPQPHVADAVGGPPRRAHGVADGPHRPLERHEPRRAVARPHDAERRPARVRGPVHDLEELEGRLAARLDAVDRVDDVALPDGALPLRRPAGQRRARDRRAAVRPRREDEADAQDVEARDGRVRPLVDDARVPVRVEGLERLRPERRRRPRLLLRRAGVPLPCAAPPRRRERVAVVVVLVQQVVGLLHEAPRRRRRVRLRDGRRGDGRRPQRRRQGRGAGRGAERPAHRRQRRPCAQPQGPRDRGQDKRYPA